MMMKHTARFRSIALELSEVFSWAERYAETRRPMSRREPTDRRVTTDRSVVRERPFFHRRAELTLPPMLLLRLWFGSR
jgi:hypothetical protein